MIKKQNVLKSTALVLFASAFVVACSKNNDTPAKLSLNDGVAIVSPVITSDTIYGNFANPANPPSVYGAVYLNLSTNPIGVSTTLDSSHDVKLYLTNNSFVAGVNGYRVKYLQNTGLTSLASLNLSNFTTRPFVDSIGRSTTTPPNGWYTYTPPNAALDTVPGFYIAAISSTKQAYAIKFRYAGGDGGATSNRGKYIIQYGPLF
jgi:hypothetical protein